MSWAIPNKVTANCIFDRHGRVADRAALKSVAVGRGPRVPRPNGANITVDWHASGIFTL